jgi:hypothetical protein
MEEKKLVANRTKKFTILVKVYNNNNNKKTVLAGQQQHLSRI